METSSTPVPAPPRLHWIAAVALTIVTLGLFAPAWMIRQAWWMKRADGDAKALAGLIASITIFAAASIVAEQIGGGSGALITRLANIGLTIGVALAYFEIRAGVEALYGVRLSGPLTFFFNVYYLQYHMRRIARGEHETYSDRLIA